MNLYYICAMFSRLSRFCIFSLFAVLLIACTGYNKVLKSTDSEFKFKKAEEYFHQGKYGYAVPLLEDLIPIFRGTAKSEKVFYYFAMSHYQMEDYMTAGIYLKSFVKTFPKSPLAEECAYLAAMCAFHQSPKSSLDQSDTYLAINDFQLFLNKYPQTVKKDTVNLMMVQLRSKLEKKSYEVSKLYYQTEKYKSAVVALNNTLKEFPNTKYEEEILFMLLKSNFELALNSIENKKRERLEETIKAYERYIDRYAQSKKTREAEDIYKNTQLEIQKLNNQYIAL